MPVGEREPYSLEQSHDASRRERCGDGARRDASMPTGFRRVDIADSRDHGLVEQHRLDWPTFAGEACAKQWCCERGVFGFGAKSKLYGRIRCVVRHGAERARVHEHGAPAVVEIEGDPCMGRESAIAPIQHPVAIHPKMNQERRTIGEMHELVLPATLHRLHTLALDAADVARREMPALRGMVRTELLDDATANHAPQATNGKLDFR